MIAPIVTALAIFAAVCWTLRARRLRTDLRRVSAELDQAHQVGAALRGHSLDVEADRDQVCRDRDQIRRELAEALGPHCSGCGQANDPDVCHCGTLAAAHSYHDGHAPVPMGCVCGYVDRAPDWERIAAVRSRLIWRARLDRDSARRWLATTVRIARLLRARLDEASSAVHALQGQLDLARAGEPVPSAEPWPEEDRARLNAVVQLDRLRTENEQLRAELAAVDEGHAAFVSALAEEFEVVHERCQELAERVHELEQERGICHDRIAFVDGELDPQRAEAFRKHLRVCERCRDAVIEAHQVSTRLASLGELPR